MRRRHCAIVSCRMAGTGDGVCTLVWRILMFMVQEWIKDRWYTVQVFMDKTDAETYLARLGGNLRIKEL